METQTALSLIKQAEKAYQSKNHNEAARLFQQAADIYAQIGDERKHAELMNNVSVSLLQSGSAQAALEATQGTEMVFAHYGEIRLQALALGNQAFALDELNRLDEAMALYQQCSDLLKQAGDEASRAYVLKKISALQIRTGHQFEALASMETALNHTDKLSLQERFLKKLLRVPMDMLRRGK